MKVIKNISHSSLFIIISVFLHLSAFSDPIISIQTDKNEYAVGDLVCADISISGNQGFHNLYFDLLYDNSVMAFDRMEAQTPGGGEWLYAVSRIVPEYDLSGKLIVSFTLPAGDALQQGDGSLLKLYFRIINPKNQGNVLGFSHYALEQTGGDVVFNTLWLDSDPFFIKNNTDMAYIRIKSPAFNEAFMVDTISVAGICTDLEGAVVILSNLENNDVLPPLEQVRGVFYGSGINLVPGYNRLNAGLYNEGGNLLCLDTILVYRSEDNQFIKIIHPEDHMLVNTDMIEVKVVSSYSGVKIHGVMAEATGETYNSQEIYASRVWLNKGFNKITAEVTHPGGAQFKDTVTVYYEKDDSLFSFITPSEGEVFKSVANNNLVIRGQIGSMYNNDGQPHSVTIQVIYYPENPVLASRMLIRGEKAIIEEAESTMDQLMAPYTFSLPGTLNLADLDTGRLEIIAYKNKYQQRWDSEIHRFVYVNNSEMRINLIQPLIYTADTLDIPARLRQFNNQQDPETHGIQLAADGQFVLTTTENRAEITEIHPGAVCKKIIESHEGHLYALLNDDKDMAMRIYKKEMGKNEWQVVWHEQNMYGYDLCDTDLGVLVGVSQVGRQGHSGLYLLDHSGLKNIILGKPAVYVQFIININNTIYLYGNNYLYLYHFPLHSLEKDGDQLKAGSVEEIGFGNQLACEQFLLSPDMTTAWIRTVEGTVCIYRMNQQTNCFAAMNAGELNLSQAQWEEYSQDIAGLVQGNIKQGNYYTFLCVKENRTDSLVIMHNKTTGRLIVRYVNLNILLSQTLFNGPVISAGEKIMAIGYRDEMYHFICAPEDATSTLYKIVKGKLYFDTFSVYEQVKLYSGEEPLFMDTMDLLVTSQDHYYAGFGRTGTLSYLSSRFPTQGTIQFCYNNPDAEGIVGFSFEVDPVWLPAQEDQQEQTSAWDDFIHFQFSTLYQDELPGEMPSAPTSLTEFLESKNDFYIVSHEYRPGTGKNFIRVDFNNLLEEQYLHFFISLNSHTISPSIYNLTIYKKNKIKIPNSSTLIQLPIHGMITDPTVGEVYIQGTRVDLERDNSFYYTYQFKKDEESATIRLYCTNSVGESVQLSFTVDIIESVNTLSHIKLRDPGRDDLPVSGHLYYSSSRDILVEGYYYSMLNALVGYELYDYITVDGKEQPILIKQDIFVHDPGMDSLLETVITDEECADWPSLEGNESQGIKSGFCRGHFAQQPINLIPGRQRLVLYVENPGGFRTEYRIENQYPELHYSIAQEDEGIYITAPDFTTAAGMYGDYPLQKEGEIETRDTLIGETNGQPVYCFKKELIFFGEIFCSSPVQEIIARTSSDSFLFENARQQINVKVDQGNRFQIKLHIQLPEEVLEETGYICFLPFDPFQNRLKTAVKMVVKKRYEDSFIIPDFSPLKSWKEEEKGSLEKEIRLSFNRLIPVGADISMVLNFNYEKTISGELSQVSSNPGEYRVENRDNGSICVLDPEHGLKSGRNRLQWDVRYMGRTISSSRSGRMGMQDFFFDLESGQAGIPTDIDFPIEPNHYYSTRESNTIPNLCITRDRFTVVLVRLNRELIKEMQADSSLEDKVVIPLAGHPFVKQGRNKVAIYYKEPNCPGLTQEFSFLYDSKAPQVVISSYRYSPDYRVLLELTALAWEENLADVSLEYNGSLVDLTPEIMYKSTGVFHIRWKDMDAYPFAEILPASSSPLKVIVKDHAGNSSEPGALFYGLEDFDRPQKLKPVLITSLEPLYYQVPGTPSFGYNEPEGQDILFARHAKFYPPSVNLENDIISGSINLEREDIITAGNSLQISEEAGCTVRAHNIHLAPGFNLREGGCLSLGHHLFSGLPSGKAAFSLDHESEKMSLVFWFRYEHESFYAQDESYRKICTLLEREDIIGGHVVCDDLYLAYKGPFLSLVHEHTNPETPEQPSLVRDIILGDNGEIPLSDMHDNDWNLIVLGLDGENQIVSLAVDTATPVAASLLGKKHGEQDLMALLLARDAAFYFGNNNRDESGHYSLADAFMIDRLCSFNDIWDLIDDLPPSTLAGLKTKSGAGFCFNSPGDGIGPGENLLRTENEDHYFSPYENANYTEPAGYGSLRASRLQKNLLTISETNPAEIKFVNTEVPILFNLTVEPAGSDTISFKPENTSYEGRYYFGNTFTNHGLQTDAWYSLSGLVMEIEKESPDLPDPCLVLRINGREESFPLKKGEFHFIYPHDPGSIPESVILYLKTPCRIELDKHLMLNEGNYILPLYEEEGGLAKTSVSTAFAFEPAGTIEFWYKPFTINAHGCSAYETVLFDSDYLCIGTAIKPESDQAVYYLRIGTNEMITDVPVSMGWSHIQVSYHYNITPNARSVAYFYINGELAAGLERSTQDFPAPPHMNGVTPAADNLRIGADLGEEHFAQGFIDEIIVSHFFKNSTYKPHEPFEWNYITQPDPGLLIKAGETLGPGAVTYFCYDINRKDGGYTMSGTIPDWLFNQEHMIPLGDLPAGVYQVLIRAVCNGHNYQSLFSFLKKDKPCFIPRYHTPILVTNKASDLSFAYEYDESYLQNEDKAHYPAIGVKITYTDSGASQVEQIQYMSKNFETPNDNNWLVGKKVDDQWEWQPVELTDGLLRLHFPQVRSMSPVMWEMVSFYFDNQPELNNNQPFTTFETDQGTIGIASLGITPVKAGDGKEYKLALTLCSEGSPNEEGLSPVLPNDLFRKFTAAYTIKSESTLFEKTGTVAFGDYDTIFLSYDDVLITDSGPAYGTYNATFSLFYDGQVYDTQACQVNWEQPLNVTVNVNEKTLSLIDFSLLFLNKSANTGSFYVEFKQNNLDGLSYTIHSYSSSLNTMHVTNGAVHDTDLSRGFSIIDGVLLVRGDNMVKIELSDSSGILKKNMEILIQYSTTAPEVMLTNSVPSCIGYNNVSFSWRGYHEGSFNQEIKYSYNFDNKGWSVANSESRHLELYGLAEGYHIFKVKSIYENEESPEATVTFFVDTRKPLFDPAHIILEKIYDSADIMYAVRITGNAGAVTDASLTDLFIDGVSVPVDPEGSFTSGEIRIPWDGINIIRLTAFDKVGNFTDHLLSVENYVTTINYPDNSPIRYMPMTLVGRLNKRPAADMHIYVLDSGSSLADGIDFTQAKEARINEDLSFFVDDIRVNPGTSIREACTLLYLIEVFSSGTCFIRKVDVRANELIRPIEITMSTHSVEGDTAQTEVEFLCKANVHTISSWSIDFDGDGIYDVVDIVDHPGAAGVHSWTHVYSSLGNIRPRVRIVTNEGNFFSVCEELIIHEKFQEPTNTQIADPLSLSAVSMPDGSDRLFVLCGGPGAYRVEVYSAGKNDTSISRHEFTISLNDYPIEEAERIRAADPYHFYLLSNKPEPGTIYCFEANATGNYFPVDPATVRAGHDIADIDMDQANLYASFMDTNQILVIPHKDKILQPANQYVKTLDEEIDGYPPGKNMHLACETGGVFAADFYNQRILCLSGDLQLQRTFGRFGTGEGEFLKPVLIRAFENRIFVYDESRMDVQVFDADFKRITCLSYRDQPEYANYLEADLLADVKDMCVLVRESNSLLYYYVLLLSRSCGKIVMLKMPQWEELTERMQDNRIVFVRNQEIFISKPDGSDMMRVLCSDALPRIEGSLDYPALSPDGRMLCFTSKQALYDRSSQDDMVDVSFPGFYTHLYTYDLKDKKLARISLSEIDQYEIERPVFSFNGDKLIFSAKPITGLWQIYIYDLKEGTVSKLPLNSMGLEQENARFPYYSPDDRFVAFVTDHEGDEEIEIVDTTNPSIRVAVTYNNCRDALPVWSACYPLEIRNPDYKIRSKIVFVSERNFHKGLYSVYIAQPTDADIRVVNESGTAFGENVDDAAVEITTRETEGDYPAVTGDGKTVIFEYFNSAYRQLKKYHFETGAFTDVDLPAGASRPAGMKNSITHFTVREVNGEDVLLSWIPYTDKEIFYSVCFCKNNNKENEPLIWKKVFTSSSTKIQGLEMGVEYLFKVCILEKGIEVATSQWKTVRMPEVIARPSFEIDSENPYLVKLKAWKPKPETEWNFTWIIDNQEFKVQYSTEYLYEFATSGLKTILLKVSNKAGTQTGISTENPLRVDIISPIRPVIEYKLSEDRSYVELDASNSAGSNFIDWEMSEWRLCGPGREDVKQIGGPQAILGLNGFKQKINIHLVLKRKPVNGQQFTDTVGKHIVVDLDYMEVKPVITYEVDKKNDHLFIFSGENSFGNIDWPRVSWVVFADGTEVCLRQGVSTFAFEFPDNGQEMVYSVALTVPRANDGTTNTATMLVPLKATPIVPQIDYEILTTKEGENITAARLMLSCTQSRGDHIDYNQARWAVAIPSGGSYGDLSSRTGPTAIYNLSGVEEDMLMEVNLTLMRVGGSDPVTVTKIIRVKTGEIPRPEAIVRISGQGTETGTVVTFDASASTGANIEWNKTEWQFTGYQLTKRGPVAILEVPAADAEKKIPWICTLYYDGRSPLTKTGVETLAENKIEPVISYHRLPGSSYVYELSGANSTGINIDWEKTRWYIFDGNENCRILQGAAVTHAFKPRDKALGYPVMVEMFFNNSGMPFVGYTTIDIEADELLPVITWDKDIQDPSIIHFSAHKSPGSGIDFSKARWSFGDNSESQYGPHVTHVYPIEQTMKNYKVSLTLFRQFASGETESKTGSKDIDISSDEIKPVIKACLYDDGYLVLSSEESRGRGLLLDRSNWLFEGEGDNETLTINRKIGTVKSEAYSTSESHTDERGYSDQTQKNTGTTSTEGGNTQQTTNGESSTHVDLITRQFGGSISLSIPAVTGIPISFGISANGSYSTQTGYNTTTQNSITTLEQITPQVTTYDTTTEIDGYHAGSSDTSGGGHSVDSTSYKDLIDNTSTFSSANCHTGAVCRKYVGTYDITTAARGEKRIITVTLMVYRPNSRGGIDGRSVTVNIDLEHARTKGGIRYE